MADKDETTSLRDYPRWRYHDELAAVIVKTKDDEAAQTPDTDGWRDTPEAPATKPVPPAASKPTPPPTATPVSTKPSK